MDFLTLLQRLHKHSTEFVVVGGYASMLLGSDMLTQDLDICVRLSSENLNRIYDSVDDLNPRYRMGPDKKTITREMATADSIKNLYLQTDLGSLDCLGRIEGLGDYDLVLQYAREIKLDFGTIKTLDFDGLIIAKSALKRQKDILTVKKLEAIRSHLKKDS
ncbi:hypothetical protein [Rubellicoccus peritrichatus]|uniref:Nucleotidyltransferase n=1 Tax=Rubellicoccus peritrichatus TaxID=3080537 RepID=A0AAQ3LCL8_9BACT|nr:hypothetical protein [Puniceicoccus sp. CR14]WOO41113.1 hypothetical protein RZN69_21035 [Puniceicoccus sp. CR14]